VLALTKTEAVLDAGRRTLRLPIDLVRVTSTRPETWAVVQRPPDAKGSVALWGDSCYVICPLCCNRARLRGTPRALRCGRCDGEYHIGWDEWFSEQA
jgi:hypothetical protein